MLKFGPSYLVGQQTQGHRALREVNTNTRKGVNTGPSNISSSRKPRHP